MAKLNERGHEIWFDRMGWSYIPSHWKGMAAVMTIVIALVPLVIFFEWCAPALTALPLIGGVGFGLWLGNRHSSPRS